MKKLFLTALSCMMLCMLSAQQVDPETARKVAEKFYAQQHIRKSAGHLELYVAQTDGNHLQKSAGNTVSYYIFNDDGKGFVMISGDRRSTPVLAYSTSGSFDTTDMPDNLRWWLQNYREEIAGCRTQEIPADAMWEAWLEGQPMQVMGSTAVTPLIQSRWNQMDPYNQLCPYDSKAKHRCPSGCVATAMAQVLYFWQFPVKGSGSHSYNHKKYGNLSANFGNTAYDWNSMTKTYGSSSSAAAKSAVATLMYHCGVSIDMEYDTSGSGAILYMPDKYVQYYGYCDARTAMMRYFNCDTAIGYYRSDYSNVSNWISLLKGELDAGRPILYGGTGTAGGHAFVCDGYDASNKFHMNWGWGGTSDGYFTITALNPSALGTGGGAGGFNTNQQAVFVRPGDDTKEYYDLRLYSQPVIDKDTVPLNAPFSVTASIGNFGDSTYRGSYTLALYKSDGTFVCNMGTKNNCIIPSQYYDAAVFSTTGISTLTDGIYYGVVCYRQGEKWKEVNSGEYTNKVRFLVGKGAGMEYDLRLYGSIHVSSDPVTYNTEFYFTDSIANYSAKDFSGYIGVSIQREDGTTIGVFGKTKMPVTLQQNYFYPNMKCIISADNGLAPGKYTASLVYTTDEDGSWHLLGDGNFGNRINFTVSDGSAYIMKLYSMLKINKDPIPYNSSFTITVSIINRGIDAYQGKLTMGIFDTQGNIVDYVQTYENVSLGKNKYFSNVKFTTSGMATLKPGTYVAKACLYNTKTSQWEIILDGNYSNSLTITVTGGVGIGEVETAGCLPYPNPTSDKVYLNLNAEPAKVQLVDESGRVLSSFTSSEPVLEIDLSAFAKGVYFILLNTEEKHKAYKVVRK